MSAQTLTPIETLIIDDGSTEPQTLAILDNLSDPAIKVIRQKNRGLAGARNSGIRHASGDYVYFLDADDVLFPDCLEKLVGLLHDSEDDAIAACCGIKLLGGERDGIEWRATYYPYLILVENTWAAGLMLRRKSIEELSLSYDESMRRGYEDWEFNIRLAQTGRIIKIHPGALYHYRIHPDSMLAASRNRHVELVSYIRNKHQDLFAAQRLQKLKQTDFPALAVPTRSEENFEMAKWMDSQTFKDYVFTEANNYPANCRYRLLHAGVAAVSRLPPEAIEGAIMFLESNQDCSSCVLAVRLGGTESTLGTTWTQEQCQPVALVARNGSSSMSFETEAIIDNCENLVRFADQIPSSKSGWKPVQIKVDNNRKWNIRDPVAIRKWLSLTGEKLLGAQIKDYLVRQYDSVYYRLHFSDTTVMFRKKVKRILGERGEMIVARIFYAAFLAKPPSEDEPLIQTSWNPKNPDPSPLFLNPERTDAGKITLLIVTAWLNQGGIEREIIDLCSHLDRSRFKVIIATTRRSAHPWESILRSTGASIYHLAEFLTPRSIPSGLAHLILQHRVDVMHIVHSREAYESLSFIKRTCPSLSVSDRNVTFGGGFSKMSVKLGGKNIDVRTVGHQNLAQQMFAYGLARRTLRTIFAGTAQRRFQQFPATIRRNLHTLCGVSPDVPIVLFMGRLDPEKRPDIFVKMAAKVCKMRPDRSVQFAVVGDGKMRAAIETLISQLGMKERFHLLGFQLNGRDLISDSALLIITSAYEGLALVSFEAMAAGTPQISADVGGQNELITPDIGVLIENGFGEVSRYAHACTELLDDPARRARMSVAGKNKFTAQHSTENYVNEYSQIFEELGELTARREREMPSLRPPHVDPLRIFG